MRITISSTLREIQMKTGFPRFNFMSPDEIVDIIRESALPIFSSYIPYKTLFPLYKEDQVDPVRCPNLYKVIPDDAEPESVFDCGMVYPSGQWSVGGGFPRDFNRSLYGSFGLTTALYNQLRANLMSMVQPQVITSEWVQPNMIQLWPKSEAMHLGGRPVLVEVLATHSGDLSTIHPSYSKIWYEYCMWYIRGVIYERYKDYEDETIAGHQIRTKISEYSSYEDKLESIYEKLNAETIRNPDRADYFYIV